MKQRPNHLSSRELLARIGLNEDDPRSLLDDDEPLEDLNGDLGAVLRERYRLLTTAHRFAPGDLVTWKPGLKNHRVPHYGQPAVVIQVLAEPILDQENGEAGSAYFREPLDLVLGLIWDSDPGRGELISFHYDSRRFQLWQEQK